MVRRQLAARGIRDRRVLAAMHGVPRHEFVRFRDAAAAYEDHPLCLESGQTISQPYIVARMTELARLGRHSRVLEVGTGSGYHAVVMARIARHVWSVERIDSLARRARETLARLGVNNVTVVTGNGIGGYPPAAPYDAIVVAAAIERPPRALLDQLDWYGRLVIPLGPADLQQLTVITRAPDGYESKTAGGCRFVPFVHP